LKNAEKSRKGTKLFNIKMLKQRKIQYLNVILVPKSEGQSLYRAVRPGEFADLQKNMILKNPI